jgi:hypothetical protein
MSSTEVERRYAPGEATVVIGKRAFEFPTRSRGKERSGGENDKDRFAISLLRRLVVCIVVSRRDAADSRHRQ